MRLRPNKPAHDHGYGIRSSRARSHDHGYGIRSSRARSITAFSTPYDDTDKITAHMAARIREVVDVVESAARTKQAKAGAAGRIFKNRVSAVKPEVFAFWRERNRGLHPKLRTNEKFAMECMQRWPDLNSIKVITGWCTQWNKEEKGQSTS